MNGNYKERHVYVEGIYTSDSRFIIIIIPLPRTAAVLIGKIFHSLSPTYQSKTYLFLGLSQ